MAKYCRKRAKRFFFLWQQKEHANFYVFSQFQIFAFLLRQFHLLFLLYFVKWFVLSLWLFLLRVFSSSETVELINQTNQKIKCKSLFSFCIFHLQYNAVAYYLVLSPLYHLLSLVRSSLLTTCDNRRGSCLCLCIVHKKKMDCP